MKNLIDDGSIVLDNKRKKVIIGDDYDDVL